MQSHRFQSIANPAGPRTSTASPSTPTLMYPVISTRPSSTPPPAALGQEPGASSFRLVLQPHPWCPEPEVLAALSFPRIPRNQTKTLPCLEPNQGPLGPRTRSKLLSVAPKGLRSSPTLAALSQLSTRLPDGNFWNTHSELLAPSTLHMLFPLSCVWLTLTPNRPGFPASRQQCLGQAGLAQWRHSTR